MFPPLLGFWGRVSGMPSGRMNVTGGLTPIRSGFSIFLISGGVFSSDEGRRAPGEDRCRSDHPLCEEDEEQRREALLSEEVVLRLAARLAPQAGSCEAVQH